MASPFPPVQLDVDRDSASEAGHEVATAPLKPLKTPLWTGKYCNEEAALAPGDWTLDKAIAGLPSLDPPRCMLLKFREDLLAPKFAGAAPRAEVEEMVTQLLAAVLSDAVSSSPLAASDDERRC